MNEALQRFFDELDRALIAIANGQRLDLYHIGRSALVWRFQAAFSTKDIDVVQLQMPPEQNDLLQKAHALFGRDSTKAKELGLYLDLVLDPLPPVPAGFRNRCTEVAGDWKVIRLWQLEVHDLAATKMRCFRPQDRQDLRFLCDQGLLAADALRLALEKAFTWSLEKDGDPWRDTAFANLQRVIDYLEGRSATL